MINRKFFEFVLLKFKFCLWAHKSDVIELGRNQHQNSTKPHPITPRIFCRANIRFVPLSDYISKLTAVEECYHLTTMPGCVMG